MFSDRLDSRPILSIINGDDVTFEGFTDSGLELDTAGVTVHLPFDKDFADGASGTGQRAQAKYGENNSCDSQSLGHFLLYFFWAFY